MRAFTAALLLIPFLTLPDSCALSPADCDATEPLAGKVLDLINKGRWNGYLFQLLRVADAHLDRVESATVYYLVLDVKESDCPVLSRKHWDDCDTALSRRLSEIVIGQCKVIATYLNASQDLRVNGFNCTTSSVSSALANNKDSPVLFDFFEDIQHYRTQANKALEKYKKENGDFAFFRVDRMERVTRARGGERTKYYLDFSVRNCSRSHHFPRHYNAFGFCRADLSYDVGVSDLETPNYITINCEVFNLEDHRNISGIRQHFGHPLHPGGHEHSLAGKPPFKPDEFRDHHHPHKPHKHGCPPPLEDKNQSDRPSFQEGAPPVLPTPELKCHHPHFGTNRTHGYPHNHSSSKDDPHGHPSHRHDPHGHHPHGHHPHGHHPHGHHPHGHHPHGHHPHRHHPHGHHPHGHHPHDHDFLDHGPCDPLPQSKDPRDHRHQRHGPPSRHPEERGPGKGHFPFHWRQIGYIYQLSPLKKDEVLPLPEANFPSFSLPGHSDSLKPEIQPFPQSASESCPGTFNSEFSHISKLLPSLTQESSQEIDCNDEDLFKAVDAALKKYNSKNQSGNQFVLYRVTEVTRTDDPDTFYSFKYQIKEGDCSVQSGKMWQDCDYKEAEHAATGECSATVGKRGNTKFSVATQTCQITPAEGPVVTSQYDCLGCVHPISTASPDLEPVLRHAVQHFNNHTQHSHLFALREVKRAHRQVVAGWNYEITYSIVQTNCSKEHFLFLTPDCKSLLNGDIGECTDHAHMDPQLRIASLSQKCELFPGEDFVEPPPKICAGCPIKIPVNSPELEEALNHSTAKLNAENNGTYYFKIDIVRSATVQVVAGKKFFIEFTARETKCSKESNEKLTENCEANKFGEILDCQAEVYVIPWEEKIFPTVHCQSLRQTSLMKRPPGFSPFRSVQVEKVQEGTTVSPPHTSMALVQDEERDSEKEQGHTRGHGWGHGKQVKHGFGHGFVHEHDQGHGHKRGRGLGHGHQKQHGCGHGRQQQHGLGHGHQREFDYDLEHQGRHGLGHGHQRGHGLAHGHKREHGHGHGKCKNKRKDNEKDNGWRIEHLSSSSEESTTSSAQTQEKTEGPTTPLPFLAQPGVAVTLPDFQDSDLIATGMSNTPPAPTESDDDWIPDIQIEKSGLSFNLIPDLPEKSSPKCPGRPWKPVNGKNPTVEKKEFHDFDLSDALY